MSDNISYLKIPHLLGLQKGDVVLLSSDLRGILVSCLKNGERFDGHKFLEEFLSVVGDTGTLLLPTYSWDFCHGKVFDYINTPSCTGSLSTLALKRDDFKRTRHPLYSFAVAGKYQDLLVSMDNKSSFGSDSPFSFMELTKAKNIIIDVNLTHSFTYVHYNEERAGINTYRFLKSFTSIYRDENGQESERTYTMLVRDLNDYYGTDFDPLEEEFKSKGIMTISVINGVTYRVVDLFKASAVILDDVRNNQSRKLCKHKWQ